MVEGHQPAADRADEDSSPETRAAFDTLLGLVRLLARQAAREQVAATIDNDQAFTNDPTS